MGGLKESNGSLTFLNIKEGNLVVKQQDGTLKAYRSIGGKIGKISFVKETFEGKEYEKAKIYINNAGDGYLLQIRTDLGYFRGFCNSLRSSSDPKAEVEISPSYKKEADKFPQTTCFVSQNGKPLKHAFTKDNPGDFPALKIIESGSKKLYDNTEQIEYWKNWLLATFKSDTPEVQETTDSGPAYYNPPVSGTDEPLDDLPF